MITGDAVADQLAVNPSDILKVIEHPDYQFSVPTSDHFIPTLYLAGIAATSGERMDAVVRGYAMRSLSMTCYGIGAGVGCPDESGAAPIPEAVPPEQSNIWLPTSQHMESEPVGKPRRCHSPSGSRKAGHHLRKQLNQ